MPAGFRVDFGAQAERTGGGRGNVAAVGGGVPGDELRPDQHQFTLAEVVAVLDGLRHGFTTERTDITKGAQLLADAGKRCRHRLVIQSRYAEDTRFDTTFSLGGQ
ncbi:hypothetical protein D3C75_956810 [compost metagenome]